jgi:chromosome partitioning protein
MPRVLTVASQKGGVGKTTTSVNLAASLAKSGKRVLLIDFDPQGNASSGAGFRREPETVAKADGKAVGPLGASLSGKPLSPLVHGTKVSGLKLIPSCAELSQLDLIQDVQRRGLASFRTEIIATSAEFEYVIFDCPPSLGGLPTIALSVSSHVLIPVQCEYYAMEGLSQILPIIRIIQKSVNSELKIAGLLLTMFSEELDLSGEVVKEVAEYFGDSVFRTIIPRDVVLAEAASHGVPAFEYAPLSRGAWAYLELAKEVLSNDRS